MSPKERLFQTQLFETYLPAHVGVSEPLCDAEIINQMPPIKINSRKCWPSLHSKKCSELFGLHPSIHGELKLEGKRSFFRNHSVFLKNLFVKSHVYLLRKVWRIESGFIDAGDFSGALISAGGLVSGRCFIMTTNWHVAQTVFPLLYQVSSWWYNWRAFLFKSQWRDFLSGR